MEDISVLSDSMKRVWHITEEIQNSITETTRWRLGSRPHAWRPPTDLYETEDALIVRVEIAGMGEHEFNISLVERNLIIRGIRQDTSERGAFHQLEIAFGEFISVVELPYLVDSEKVEATYKDGFLRIVLPKALAKHIKVEGD